MIEQVGRTMEGPRPLFDHELGEFVDFLSTQLRPSHAWSIAEEYPLAIHDANLNNVRVIKEENHFVSAAVMKPLVIKSPAGLFKVAAIGSVVTAPEHRNRGLSRQIMDDCLKAAQEHGCDFAILWTNLFDFYRKLGFELAGGKAGAFKFLNALKIIKLSNNLGDSKSLITHPATTTHQRLKVEDRAALGISDGLVRLSVGLETPADLVRDVTEAVRAAVA